MPPVAGRGAANYRRSQTAPGVAAGSCLNSSAAPPLRAGHAPGEAGGIGVWWEQGEEVRDA